MRETRDLPARIVLVTDVALRCLHQLRFGAYHRLQCRVAITALDRFLDGADRAAQLGPSRLVDDGAAGNLAGRLLGGSRIGHLLKIPSAVTDRGWPGSLRPRPFNLMIDADVFREFFRECRCWSRQARKDGVTQRTAAAGLRPPPLRVL